MVNENLLFPDFLEMPFKEAVSTISFGCFARDLGNLWAGIWMIGLLFLQEVVAVVLSSDTAGTDPPPPSTGRSITLRPLDAGLSAKGGRVKL